MAPSRAPAGLAPPLWCAPRGGAGPVRQSHEEGAHIMRDTALGRDSWASPNTPVLPQRHPWNLRRWAAWHWMVSLHHHVTALPLPRPLPLKFPYCSRNRLIPGGKPDGTCPPKQLSGRGVRPAGLLPRDGCAQPLHNDPTLTQQECTPQVCMHSSFFVTETSASFSGILRKLSDSLITHEQPPMSALQSAIAGSVRCSNTGNSEKACETLANRKLCNGTGETEEHSWPGQRSLPEPEEQSADAPAGVC